MAADSGEGAKRGRKIVVAVDEGEESMHALSWCIRNIVSGERGDQLVLVYAIPHRAIYTPMDGTGYLFSEEIVESMDKYGQEVADSVVQRAKSVCSGLLQNVEVETVVRKGDPRDVICEAVDKLKCDLLVLGTHGYGLIKRALLGSVSSYCAQNAKCPVLIVKRPKN